MGTYSHVMPGMQEEAAEKETLIALLCVPTFPLSRCRRRSTLRESLTVAFDPLVRQC